MRLSLFSPALVAALVGYGSTIALVLSAAAAVGATVAQTASWVFAICLAKAVGAAFLSITQRVPVVLAWSTPGAALIAAAFEEVDATPMEGFDPAKLDEILKLRERGLRSVAIVPLGYRADEGDWLVNLKKVRRPLEQFVTEVK